MNLENFVEFYKTKYKANTTSINTVTRLWNQVNEHYLEIKERTAQNDKEVYESIFADRNLLISIISPSTVNAITFYHRKRILKMLIDYISMHTEGVNTDVLQKMVQSIQLSEAQKNIIRNQSIYFKDLSSILSYVEYSVSTLCNINGTKYNPHENYLAERSMIILLWYNLTDDQITNLKKHDISKRGTSGIININNEKSITINYNEYQILNDYASATSQKQISGSQISLKNTPYLFRGIKKDRIDITSYIQEMFKKISKQFEGNLGSLIHLSPEYIKLNGFYFFLKENIAKGEPLEKLLKEHFKDRIARQTHCKQFKLWLNEFYPEIDTTKL